MNIRNPINEIKHELDIPFLEINFMSEKKSIIIDNIIVEL